MKNHSCFCVILIDYKHSRKTDEEKLALLERFMDNEPKSSTMLMYKKYKEIIMRTKRFYYEFNEYYYYFNL